MKRCCTCTKTKPFSDFYKSKTSPDGYGIRCKDCDKDAGERYRTNNPEKRQESVRNWDRNNRDKDAASKRRWSKNNPDKMRQRNHNYKANNPDKVKAHKAVGHAVESGKLAPVSAQLCIECGNQAQEYHHHLGYEQEHWLDVIPLCKLCHCKEHSTVLQPIQSSFNLGQSL